MRRLAAALLSTLAFVPLEMSAAPAPRPAATAPATQAYFPDRLNWERKRPEQVGMNAARLDEAVKLAIASENPANKGSMMNFLAANFGAREPLDTPIGPVKDRGVPSGIVMRNGYIVAEWGEPARVDMTFSVTRPSSPPSSGSPSSAG
jgi:hypothetical protein